MSQFYAAALRSLVSQMALEFLKLLFEGQKMPWIGGIVSYRALTF